MKWRVKFGWIVNVLRLNDYQRSIETPSTFADTFIVCWLTAHPQHIPDTKYSLSTIMSFLTIYTSSGVFARMMIFFSSISHLYRLFRFLFLSFNLYQFHFFSFLISRIDKSNFPNYTHNIMYSIAYIVSSCIHGGERNGKEKKMIMERTYTLTHLQSFLYRRLKNVNCWIKWFYWI